MSERQTRSSRNKQPTQNNKQSRVLNYLIAGVILLIVITGAFVFKWQDKVAEEDEKGKQDIATEEVQKEPEEQDKVADQDVTNEIEPTDNEKPDEDIEQTVIEKPSNDPIVESEIVNPNWQPTPTTQTGQHVSSFAENTVDWKEKVSTITAVTGLAEENMIIWRLQNNGSADTALAVVSTMDKSEKYRISMKWVDQEGWLPLKLEKLKTIEGSY